jgi:hypothetical protein
MVLFLFVVFSGFFPFFSSSFLLGLGLAYMSRPSGFTGGSEGLAPRCLGSRRIFDCSWDCESRPLHRPDDYSSCLARWIMVSCIQSVSWRSVCVRVTRCEADAENSSASSVQRPA